MNRIGALITAARPGPVARAVQIGLAVLALSVLTGGSSVQFATCPVPESEIIPAAWAERHFAQGDPLYEALFAPAARERLLDAPRPQIPTFLAGSVSQQTELIRKGELYIDRRADRIVLDNVDWTLRDQNYIATQLHGLVGIATLLRADRLPPDVEAEVGGHILN